MGGGLRARAVRMVEPEDEFPGFGVRLTRHGNLLRAGEVPGEGQWVGALVKSGGGTGRGRADLASLHPLRCGLSKGVMKGKDFVPDAGLGAEHKIRARLVSRIRAGQAYLR